MRHFFGYIRVSTVKQGEKGVSLQEQKSAIETYAKRQSLEIVDWFEERVTAAKSGRAVFDRMLKSLQQKKADGAIMHKIDRGARNLKDWADLAELLDRGIEVHFANESLDMHSRGGRLSADIQAVVAADYIRNLREETKKGFYGRLKQGLYPMRAPVGYLNMGKGKVKEPDPMQAPLVRKAFELYATGHYSLDRLRHDLHALGLRNLGGKQFSLNGMSVILHNPFYCGLIRIKKTKELFIGKHQPLIPKVLFDRVQQVLGGKFHTRRCFHPFLFNRLLSCKFCNNALYGEVQKGIVYYRCHTKNCRTKCVREDAIETALLQNLDQLRFSANEQAYFREQLPVLDQAFATTAEEARRSLTLRLNQVREKLDRLTDAYLDHMLDQEAYMERKNSLTRERSELEDKLANTDRDSQGTAKRFEEVLELANTASASYKSALPEQKRELLKILVSNFVVEGRIVMIELNSPFREIAERSLITSGAPERGNTRDPKSSGNYEVGKPELLQVWRVLLPNIFAQCRKFSSLLD